MKKADIFKLHLYTCLLPVSVIRKSNPSCLTRPGAVFRGKRQDRRLLEMPPIQG